MSQTPSKAWNPIDPPPDITGAGFYVGVAGYNFDDWADRFYAPARSRRARSKVDLDRPRKLIVAEDEERYG